MRRSSSHYIKTGWLIDIGILIPPATFGSETLLLPTSFYIFVNPSQYPEEIAYSPYCSINMAFHRQDHPALIPNSSDICPAVALTNGYFPIVDHIACYGPYLTGDAGANVSRALQDCSNSTAVVVRDGFYQTAACENISTSNYSVQVPDLSSTSWQNSSNCFFFANVTREPPIYFDTGAGFAMIEQCVQHHAANEANRYNMSCYPISHQMYPSGASCTLAPGGLCMFSLGFVLLVTSAVVLG